MSEHEWAHVVSGILLMFVVTGLVFVLAGEVNKTAEVFVYSIIIVGVPVIVRKAIAHAMDARAEHRIWHVYQYGLRRRMHFRKEVPFGLIVPLFISLISLGVVQVMTFLTYETRALKHRAAKRLGFYSFTAMTDWHNGIIGAAGIVAVLLISFVAYFAGWELLSKLAAFYAFWNMLPLYKLDGTQILFGSKILYSVLAVITLIFLIYATAL